MDAKTLIKLNEIAMKSEILGTNFEKVVLTELLKFARGVSKIIPFGSKKVENTPSNKVMTFIKPSQKNLETIAMDGVYDVNKLQKLESTHPDFIMEVIPGKNFFGYNNEWKIHVEAKSTTTGRFKFGQNKVDNIFIDEDSQSFRYLMWFAYRSTEYYYNKEIALQEFNSMKRKFLGIFKILSGHDYRLIHAVPGNPVEWLILDDTVDLLKGHFNISPRGVLRFVFEDTDLFILEKVTASGGEIRMYSKEKIMREKGAKVTPFKKVEEATSLTPQNLSLFFKATKEITSAVSKKLPTDPKVEVMAKIGDIKRVLVNINHSEKEVTKKKRIPELVAAGTKYDGLLDILREEIYVQNKLRNKN
jgi:hypothetical protein